MLEQCGVGLAQVVEFLTGLMNQSQQEELQRHLDSGCQQCNDRLNSLKDFDTEPETPEQNQLLAQPLFDTELHPSPLGVRGATALTRRRLYEAENRICLDIQQLEVQPGLITLEGQVLVRGGDADEVAGAHVSLFRSEVLVHETDVDELGDFEILDVTSAVYDMKVATPNMEVVVKGIQI